MPRKVLLACTGSVAAIKVPELAAELSKLPEVKQYEQFSLNAKMSVVPCILLFVVT